MVWWKDVHRIPQSYIMRWLGETGVLRTIFVSARWVTLYNSFKTAQFNQFFVILYLNEQGCK